MNALASVAPVAPDMDIIPHGAVRRDGRAIQDAVDLYRTFDSHVRTALGLLAEGAQLVHTSVGWQFAQERMGRVHWMEHRVTETVLHTVIRHAAGLIIEPDAGRCWLPAAARAAVADKLAQTVDLSPHATSVHSLGGFLKPKTRSLFLSAMLWSDVVDCARVFNSMDDRRILALLIEKADSGNTICIDVLRTAGLRNWGRSAAASFELRPAQGGAATGTVSVALNAQLFQSIEQALKIWQPSEGVIHLSIGHFQVNGASLPPASDLIAEWCIQPHSTQEAGLCVVLRPVNAASDGAGVLTSARSTLAQLRQHWQTQHETFRCTWPEASNDPFRHGQAQTA